MGWLRLVGSLKLLVSFAKEPHKSAQRFGKSCLLESWQRVSYGVATISRLLKIIGLYCNRALQKGPTFRQKMFARVLAKSLLWGGYD